MIAMRNKSGRIAHTFKLQTCIESKISPTDLMQSIMNIVNNAKDAFKEKNQKHKEIVIKSWQDDNRIKIEISDNAGGIDEEIKEKIYEAGIYTLIIESLFNEDLDLKAKFISSTMRSSNLNNSVFLTFSTAASVGAAVGITGKAKANDL